MFCIPPLQPEIGQRSGRRRAPSRSSALNGNSSAAAASSGTSDGPDPLKRCQSPAQGAGAAPQLRAVRRKRAAGRFGRFHQLSPARRPNSPVHTERVTEARIDCARRQSLCNKDGVQKRALPHICNRAPERKAEVSETRVKLHLNASPVQIRVVDYVDFGNNVSRYIEMCVSPEST